MSVLQCSNWQSRSVAMGQERHFRSLPTMSALTPITTKMATGHPVEKGQQFHFTLRKNSGPPGLGRGVLFGLSGRDHDHRQGGDHGGGDVRGAGLRNFAAPLAVMRAWRNNLISSASGTSSSWWAFACSPRALPAACGRGRLNHGPIATPA
jgi:hypothetical protein